MAFSVQMPALGESVTEGTVTRWLKQEGDTVELDEPSWRCRPTRSTPKSPRRPRVC
ncbi:pyruvate dehydrogenase E2 component dihydrolipoamide acyltransferase [Mycobacterium tuberculosis variant africanum]|nr:pyruvate dehydrogenase E2 component dihydrolipoamide acyltransferase [Mycobacterium tuberculosis variant africanum]